MNNIFTSKAFQVFVCVLQDGPKKSWDLRRAFYGDAYLASSSKKNNHAYNRNRKAAVKAGLMVQEGKFYLLSSVGVELASWAEAEGVDLTLVKSKARAAFEEMNPEA